MDLGSPIATITESTTTPCCFSPSPSLSLPFSQQCSLLRRAGSPYNVSEINNLSPITCALHDDSELICLMLYFLAIHGIFRSPAPKFKNVNPLSLLLPQKPTLTSKDFYFIWTVEYSTLSFLKTGTPLFFGLNSRAAYCSSSGSILLGLGTVGLSTGDNLRP